MSVGADLAVAVKVVEQNVVPRDLVVVRSDEFAVNSQVRIAVAGRSARGIAKITQYLVVGPVFLNDIEDVFDWAGLADTIRDGRVAFDGGLMKLVGRVG